MNIIKEYFLPVGGENPIDNYAYNRKLLSYGVSGVGCNYAGTVEKYDLCGEILEHIWIDEMVVYAEFYENGAMNIRFVNEKENKSGVIRVR